MHEDFDPKQTSAIIPELYQLALRLGPTAARKSLLDNHVQRLRIEVERAEDDD